MGVLVRKESEKGKEIKGKINRKYDDCLNCWKRKNNKFPSPSYLLVLKVKVKL